VDDPSSHSLHIDYGRVRRTAADGRHVDVGSNFDLGAMDIFAAQPRSYEARAETEVIGYVVAEEDSSWSSSRCTPVKASLSCAISHAA
jgi:hypothetical protein